ncbi:hypothetical protein [Pedobacter hartonius]|uniref:Uncharacterized protein n=1 Tax=Pedobacter hartonius TaxID=425514 RepID=A0A1H4HGQ7_9SPHI|nr:hypothetical protein [Pedobacter hartonius]SEB20993.1 hypothetical protein SAMN05443550_11826 [Pedobacter hartonius]
MHTICEAIKIHNENMAVLVETEDYAERTLERFDVLERHIKEYLIIKYKTTDCIATKSTTKDTKSATTLQISNSNFVSLV